MIETNTSCQLPHEPAGYGQVADHSDRKLRFSRLFAVAAAFTLAACASTGGGPEAEQQVRQRAAERWQALVKGEFTRAYSYNTPGYRAVISPDAYRARFGTAISWLGSEIVDLRCPETTRCEARLRIDYKPLLSRKFGDKMSTHVDETWLLEDGQWWFFQDIKGN